LVDVHQKELDKMAIKASDSKAGLVPYLSCYKKGIKIINEGLDEETRVKYRVEAKKWTKQKPPPWQQQWYVYVTLPDWEVTNFTN
jgi:hypothetical protein